MPSTQVVASLPIATNPATTSSGDRGTYFNFFFMYKLDAPGVGGLGAGGEDASNLIIGTKDFLSSVI